MFNRLRILLAAFDRYEFCEHGLALRLERYTSRNEVTLRPSRHQTVNGMPVSWSEG